MYWPVGYEMEMGATFKLYFSSSQISGWILSFSSVHFTSSNLDHIKQVPFQSTYFIWSYQISAFSGIERVIIFLLLTSAVVFIIPIKT